MRQKVLLLMLTLLSFSLAWSQSRQISGRVMKENSTEALTGVSVTVKGTKNGTSTNNEGRFTLNVPNENNAVLIFSSVGYKAKEVTVGGNTTLEVVLTEEASTMNDVVVVGYTTVRRRDLTGSVSSAGAKELKDIPVNSAAEALTGRLAGVQVTTTEGRPGAEIQVRVRGGGSITQDNSPLYIVDGIQVENALSMLSPQEIQSIDVLKDAASTAIYGARGANGVVVITTKGGKAMKTQVTYNGFVGARSIVNKLEVMSPYDYVKYQYQIYNYNTNEQTRNSFQDRYGTFQDLDIYKNMPMTNWQEEVFGKTALSQTHALGVTGGTGTTTFNLSLNHADEEGIMLNSGFQRTLASFKFDHKISSKFRTGFNTRYSRQRVDGVGTSSSGTQGNNRLRNAVRFMPYIGPGQEDVYDVFDPAFASQTNLVSPVLLANQELRYDYRNDIVVNGYLSYEIIKNLTLKSVAGISGYDRRINTFNGKVTSVARQNNDQPVAQMQENESLSLTNSNTINYKRSFDGKHDIDLLLGEETYQSEWKNKNLLTKWLPVDITADQAFASMQKATPPQGMVQDAPSTGEGGSALFSLFGRFDYAFDRKYRATFTLRRDGSSLFAPGNRSAIFPSAAFAWNVSQEEFMDKVNFVSDLKFRFSYGTSGNNRISQDQWKTNFLTSSTDGYAFGESITPGYYPQSLANSFLQWETTVARNIGVDFTVFNKRLTASVDVYKNNTNKLLLQQKISPTSGYPDQLKNIGKTRNSGIELQLNGTVASRRDFNWMANFNIAHNTNTIISLGMDPSGNPIKSYLETSGWVSSTYQDFKVEVGKPIGQFYGYVTDGYYTVDDFIYDAATKTYTLKPEVPNSRDVALGNRDPQPGDLKLKKLSSSTDMRISTADRTVLGNAQPKFTGGFNQQFTYKSFDASVFMNFSYGNKVYNANKIEFTTQYLYKDNNMLSLMNDRWKWYDDNGALVSDPDQLRKLNVDTKYWTPPVGQYFLHSFAIEDGSFLRISNVTLGYTLPQSLVKRTKAISQLRVYGTVNNLLTITGYSGYDPEANTRRGNPLTPGVDYAAYPRSRFILAGVNVTF
jgi:TonB-dependent starch-binding outer membrane protein SusC